MEERVAEIAEELVKIETEMLGVISRIGELEREMASDDDEVAYYRREMASIESDMAADVAGEEEPDGKKTYPNETSRKAETANRLEMSGSYKKSAKNLRDAEHARRERHFELEDLRRRLGQRKDAQANRRAVLYALAGIK